MSTAPSDTYPADLPNLWLDLQSVLSTTKLRIVFTRRGFYWTMIDNSRVVQLSVIMQLLLWAVCRACFWQGLLNQRRVWQLFETYFLGKVCWTCFQEMHVLDKSGLGALLFQYSSLGEDSLGVSFLKYSSDLSFEHTVPEGILLNTASCGKVWWFCHIRKGLLD